jgi:hypothetical protein
MASQRAIDYLNRVQEANYRDLKLPLPTYSAGEFAASRDKNLAALDADKALAEELTTSAQAAGIPAARVPLVLRALRAYYSSTPHEAYAEVAREYADAPTHHIHPRDWWILKKTFQAISGVSATFPHFGLDKLLSRCVPGTLLTGMPNAFPVRVPGTDEFLILFDPTTFDYISDISESLAMLLQLREQILRDKGAEYFGERPFGGPVLAPLLAADLYSEERRAILHNASSALESFVCRGRQTPFVLDLARDWAAFADMLRHMGICFMAAHEVGHLLLHDDTESITSDEWKAQVRVMPAQMKEFQADLIAGDILAVCARNLSLADSHLLVGADLFFLCVLLREVAVETLLRGEPGTIREPLEESARSPYRVFANFKPDAPTHPPTANRFTVFLAGRQQMFQQLWQKMDETSSDLIELTDFLWKSAAGRFLALHAKQVLPAQQWFPPNA